MHFNIIQTIPYFLFFNSIALYFYDNEQWIEFHATKIVPYSIAKIKMQEKSNLLLSINDTPIDLFRFLY